MLANVPAVIDRNQAAAHQDARKPKSAVPSPDAENWARAQGAQAGMNSAARQLSTITSSV